jgi:phospholipid transport system substrate-binding protein
MPVSRRTLLLTLPVAAALPRSVVCAAEGDAPTAVIQLFYADLLAVMKAARQVPFEGRYNRLAPAISRTFNLPLMSRLAVGPDWSKLPPATQQRISDAFSRYTISTYANRFDDYHGERFEVDPSPVANANGTLVKTRLTKTNGEIVNLDYLLRQNGASWQVIDVYLSSTISELATRRSEFIAVLQREGADGLIRLLETRIATLRAG